MLDPLLHKVSWFFPKQNETCLKNILIVGLAILQRNGMPEPMGNSPGLNMHIPVDLTRAAAEPREGVQRYGLTVGRA
jgi:hypothetical protein